MNITPAQIKALPQRGHTHLVPPRVHPDRKGEFVYSPREARTLDEEGVDCHLNEPTLLEINHD